MVRVHLMSLQQQYNEINIPADANTKDAKEEDSKGSSKNSQDAKHHVYPLPDFPTTQDALAKYKKDIDAKM